MNGYLIVTVDEGFDKTMVPKPKKRYFFDMDKTYRSLDEILTPSEHEIKIATENYMQEYDKLANEFKYKTSLTDLDLSILIFCAGLQVLRWSILSNETLKFDKASDADNKISQAVNDAEFIPADMKHILLSSVPYDAIKRSARFQNIYGDFSTGIAGANHRYKTLGHDPVAGWIVGTANIATNTMTVNNGIVGFENDMLNIHSLLKEWYPSYHVKNNEIDGKTHITKVLKWTADMAVEKPKMLALSFLKQSIHMGSDFFTKQGLPLPFISLLSPETAGHLMGRDMRIDSWSVSKGALLAMIINKIVEMFHRLWFNPKRDDKKLYEVRTLKIIMYSNTLSSIMNLGYVGITNDLTKLDIGGIAVAIWRLLNDREKIRKIRAEFIDKTLSNAFQKEEDEIKEKLAQYGYAF